MSKHPKLMGLVGLCAATTFGFAAAQSVPPESDVSNPALGAGQQSPFGTPMGETGISAAEPAPPTTTLGAGPSEPASVAVTPEPQQQVIVVTPPQPEAPVYTPQQPRADRN